MKPFNLEEALAGKPVVTRDGTPVTIIKEYTRPFLTERPVLAIIHGDSHDVHSIYPITGVFNAEENDPDDLFMATKTITRWFNVYPDPDQNTINLFNSKEDADQYAWSNRIDCQSFSYEVPDEDIYN